ncbi:hypothetical protein [Streptomyces sp. bgisy084]
MTDFTPEDGEPTSFAERTKALYRKHRGRSSLSAALSAAWL